jgi:hypothetical protein
MVTVTSRPQGHKIIIQAITAHITDSSGDALVTFASHGLTDGDFIYIESDIDEYNGFWEIDAINANTFKLVQDGGFVEYYQDQEITYYQTQSHEWSSIFLPIMYKATNNRWPVNTVDTNRTVTTQTNDNGFLRLNLSGAIKSDVKALEFVQITFNDGSAVVAQIVEVITTSNIVVNLPYQLYSIATVQYYYNNYQVRVKVYAGLPNTHPWVDKKPMEEVAMLSLTPDENNNVMFSVSDYIKLNVAIKNNLTLFSLPLNLDAFTGFYIATGESYDASDNYTLYTVESDFTDDTFQGYAIAGKLPFKNVYGGDYAEYVYTSGSPARWLTNRDRLLAVEGYYFDVSFIKNEVGDFYIEMKKYLSRNYFITEQINVSDQGIGVYRIPVEADPQYVQMCLAAKIEGQEVIIDEEVRNDFDLSLWENDPESGGTAWTTGIMHPTLNSLSGLNKLLVYPFEAQSGVTYRYYYSVSFENIGVGTITFQLLFLDEDYLAVGFSYVNIPTNGVYTGYEDITPSGNAAYIAASASSIGVEMDVTLLEVYTIHTVHDEIIVDPATLTEEICIDILETCEIENGFTPSDDRRLLEDGDYRLLE